MMLPLLLGSTALLLIAVAMGLWWGLATRVQQRAAAEHAETRLSHSEAQRNADNATAQRKPTRRWAELLRRAGLSESARTL
jgi:tight adherence protein B